MNPSTSADWLSQSMKRGRGRPRKARPLVADLPRRRGRPPSKPAPVEKSTPVPVITVAPPLQTLEAKAETAEGTCTIQTPSSSIRPISISVIQSVGKPKRRTKKRPQVTIEVITVEDESGDDDDIVQPPPTPKFDHTLYD